jgi:hypothetical protein
MIDSIAASRDETGSGVAGLGAVLATLADPSESQLMAVAHRATDTTELRSPSAVAAAARAALSRPRQPRRRSVIAGAAVGAAAVAALLLLVVAGSHQAADRRSPVSPFPARIAATIPIGEDAETAAVAGRDVWVVTRKNHLVHIDAATSRVVGAPLHLAHSPKGLSARAGAGSLYVTDGDGAVMRLDPHTGRLLRRTKVGAQLGAVAVGPDALWLARSPPEGSQRGHDVVLRLDLHTLRRLGPPVAVGLHPSDIEVGSGYADVMDTDGSTVTRVDVRSLRTRQVLIGPKPADAALAGGRLWIPDPIGGVLTAIDPRLTEPPDRVLPVGTSFDAISAVGAVWVVLTRGISPRNPARLIRVDPRTGRVAGRSLDLGGGVGPPAQGDGALWFPAQSRRAVLRVVPTARVPATHPLAAPAGGQLRSGPATPGPKRARISGVAVLVDVRTRGWIAAALPFIVDVRRFDNPDIGSTVLVPDQVLGPRGSTYKVTSPGRLLAVLRRHRDLEMGAVTPTTLSGLPAQTVMLHVGARVHRAGFCADPCVPLYSRDKVTQYVAPAMRLTVLSVRGHTVAISEDTPSASSLTATGAIVRSIRFP